MAVLAQTGDALVDYARVFIDYDPQHLTVVDAAGQPAGEVVGGGSLNVVVSNAVDPALGRIAFIAKRIAPPYPKGQFIVATIRFRARLPGETEARFSRVSPRQTNLLFDNVSLLDMTINGQVSIAGPTPAIWRMRLPLVLRDAPAR